MKKRAEKETKKNGRRAKAQVADIAHEKSNWLRKFRG